MPYPDNFAASAPGSPFAAGYTAAELLCMRLSDTYCATKAQDRAALNHRLDTIADHVNGRHLDAYEVAALGTLADRIGALLVEMENIAGVAA